MPLRFERVVSTGVASVGTAYTTVYTLAASYQSTITRLNVCNKHGSQITIDIQSVKNGTTFQEVLARPLAYGSDPYTHDGTLCFKVAGDVIKVKCDQASGCDVSIDGTEYL